MRTNGVGATADSHDGGEVLRDVVLLGQSASRVANETLQECIGEAENRRLVPVSAVLSGVEMRFKASTGVSKFRQCGKLRCGWCGGKTLDHHHGREEQPLMPQSGPPCVCRVGLAHGRTSSAVAGTT